MFRSSVSRSLRNAPRTHGGLERLLHRDFVRAGKLDASVALALSRLMKLRQDADYTAELVFVHDDVEAEVQAAKRFVSAVKDVLVAGGWMVATSKPPP